MKAIIKKEFSAYFKTPIGYVFIAIFFFFAAFYFVTTALLAGTGDLSNVFSGLFNICVVIIPILTMRLLSEEFKNKTDQGLLTSPVGVFRIVVGKYLAALSVYVIACLIILVFGLVTELLGKAKWIMISSNLLGIFFLGAALISIGIFISSLTENQIVASIISFTVGLILILIDTIENIFSAQALKYVFKAISFSRRYISFTRGLINFTDILFFVSIIIIFIVFTITSVENRRYK